MAEVEFERRLERLFAASSELDDAQAFAARVERRMSRGWTARRWLIGAAGIAGGVIGASQLVFSNLPGRYEAAEQSARTLGAGLARVSPSPDILSALSSDYGLWMAVGLAVLTLGYAVSRMIDEF